MSLLELDILLSEEFQVLLKLIGVTSTAWLGTYYKAKETNNENKINDIVFLVGCSLQLCTSTSLRLFWRIVLQLTFIPTIPQSSHLPTPLQAA